MSENYDLAIAYRIYPGISKSPPIFSNDKLKLSELCLSSFKRALGDLNVYMYVILDNCSQEYKEIFLKFFDARNIEFVDVQNAGNPKTFKMQLDWLCKQNFSENVYFAEDDYFYLDNSFPIALNFLHSEVKPDFVTLYDHLDYYNSSLHKYKTRLVLYSNRVWRSVASTCMSFLCKKNTLIRCYKVFASYAKKNFDSSLWFSLTKYNLFNPMYLISSFGCSLKAKILLKAYYHNSFQIFFGKKYKLYAPIPSLATHLDGDFIAPLVNWNELWK